MNGCISGRGMAGKPSMVLQLPTEKNWRSLLMPGEAWTSLW